MAMHYSRNKTNREITLYDLIKLSEQECWEIFRTCRFGEEEKFACPDCGSIGDHRFIDIRKQWHCKHCDHRFSVTSGTVFDNRKLSYSKILCIVFCFISGLQGANANSLCSYLGITSKTGFMNVSKIREVIFETMNMMPLNGIVHIDCMHICGKPRRSNKRKKSDSALVNNKLRIRKDSIVPDQKTHPEPHNLEKLKNRRIVMTLSQLALNDNGSYGSNRTITYVMRSEKSQIILPLIKKSIAKGTIVMTDKGNVFNEIEDRLRLTHFSVNHSVEYQNELGINNNQAESFFSRMRRAEYGTFNGVSKTYLAFYAAEFAYKNDSKCVGIKDRFYSILSTLLKREPSKAFCGYNQGSRLGFEYCHY